MANLAQKLAAVTQMEPAEQAPQTVPFGDWAPDLPPLFNNKANVVINVIPAEASYLPIPAPVEQAPPVDSRVYHGISVKNNARDSYTYAATETKLWDVRPSGNTDKSSTAYTTGPTGAWDATQFGDNVIFTNYANPVQSIQAGSAGNFADLFTSTSKPQARWCDVVRNFLVLGDVNDEDGPNSNRVRWSAINDPTNMDPSSQTQSDFEDIAHGGPVQRIVGGADYGVIMQEKQITRMSYTGDARVFRFDPIDRQRGTPVPKSVVGHGRNVFYLSEEGFFVFTGTESIPIGDDRVDETFWTEFDPNNRHRVSSTMSFDRKLYGILFPGSGSTGGAPNKIFIYDWVDKRWAEVRLNLEFLTSTLSQGFTLEELDSVSSSIDDLPYSLDDPIWQGGITRLGAYTRNHRLAYFIGENLEALVDTNEFQMFGGRRAFIDFLRPLIDGATDIYCQIGGRNSQSESFDTAFPSVTNYDAEVKMNDEGLVPVDENNRYHRIRVRVPAGQNWTHMQGILAYGRPVGKF